jgi:dihydrofolate synthase/folylpolyglutamate synthase
MPHIHDRFGEYWDAHHWLLSLIQDPEGNRYSSPKTAEDRLAEMRLQIPRLQGFLKYIGDPQQEFRSIHVAGTSGKGSVTTMIAGILAAEGNRTGLHVSPYLQLCNEKLVLNGRPISPSRFAALVRTFREDYTRWRQLAPGNFLKYGEAWVALTLIFFREVDVEWAVIETGMGGRFDPTNVVNSELAIITNIDYDHTESLGRELETIAWHKAGIIKPGRPAITAEQKPSPLSIIEHEAARERAPLYRFGQEFMAAGEGTPPSLRVSTPFREHVFEGIPAGAPYQLANAGAAVMAADVVNQMFDLPISSEHLHKALAAAQMPGRFETVQARPRVILDGAHNPAKMRALAGRLAAEFPGQKVSVVFGMLGMKEGEAMLSALAPLVRRWHLTQPNVLGKPAMPSARLAALLHKMDVRSPVSVHPILEDALDAGLAGLAREEILVVTGSLYLVGAARNRWFPRELLLDTWENAWDAEL